MKRFNLLFLILLLGNPVFSQNRALLEQERLQIIDKIDFISGILKKNVIDKENTLQYINSLHLQIQNREKILANLKTQILDLNNEIEKKTILLDSLTFKKNQFREKQAKLIRSNYLNVISKNKYLFLFSSDGWDNFLDRKRYINQYNDYIYEKLSTLNNQEKEIQRIIKEINLNKSEVEKFLFSENENLIKLNEESELKKQLLNKLSSNEAKFKAMLKIQKTQREELNKSIENIIIKRLTNNNETTSDEKNFAGSDKFSNYKSKLSWPVSKAYVSNGFGRHSHPGLPGVYTNNSGIDIITNPNETIKAVYDGDVVGLMHINGFNWMVILRHGEYYSVYSKLESVTISKGDRVLKNQSLGKISENGEFHFQIWHMKTKLDPELWLNKSIN